MMFQIVIFYINLFKLVDEIEAAIEGRFDAIKRDLVRPEFKEEQIEQEKKDIAEGIEKI